MTFSRSRAFVYVRASDSNRVLASLSRLLGRWEFQRTDVALTDYRPVSGHEVCALYWRPADPETGWMALALEDLQNVFETAYALSKQLESIPVVASRTYQYGDWEIKGYIGSECILKVGNDPDHELAWVGPRLRAEAISEMVSKLGGADALESFLNDALNGNHRPASFENWLGIPPLRQGFEEIRGEAPSEWTFASWAHASSQHAV